MGSSHPEQGSKQHPLSDFSFSSTPQVLLWLTSVMDRDMEVKATKIPFPLKLLPRGKLGYLVWCDSPRQDLSMKKLALDSLGSSLGWPRTHDHPASALPVLGSQAFTTTPGLKVLLF